MTATRRNDPVAALVHDAFKAVCEAEGIAHPAGMRDVLPHLYEAHTALNHARSALRSRQKESK